MITYNLTADLAFASDASEAEFDAFADRILDELDKLADLIDPDTAGSLVAQTLSVTAGVTANDVADALATFSAAVRTALHAAEINTSQWPTFELRTLQAGAVV